MFGLRNTCLYVSCLRVAIYEEIRLVSVHPDKNHVFWGILVETADEFVRDSVGENLQTENMQYTYLTHTIFT